MGLSMGNEIAKACLLLLTLAMSACNPSVDQAPSTAEGALTGQQDQPSLTTVTEMNFEIGRSEPTLFNGDGEPIPIVELHDEWIIARGRITENTPSQFVEFLGSICPSSDNCPLRDRPITTIYLDSIGGNLSAGMALGELIRSHQLNTAVAQTIYRNSNGERDDFKSPGRCLSACAYAFLGGVRRSIRYPNTSNDQEFAGFSEIGVHRFFRGMAEASAFQRVERQLAFSTEARCAGLNDEAMVQCIDGVLVSYILDMGVDAEFFTAATNQDAIKVLSRRQLEQLNVLTIAPFSDWTPLYTPLMVGVASGRSAYTIDDRTADISQISITCSPMFGSHRLYIELGFPSELRKSMRQTSSEEWEATQWLFRINGQAYLIEADRFVLHPSQTYIEIDQELFSKLGELDLPIQLTLTPLDPPSDFEFRRPLIEAELNEDGHKLLKVANAECDTSR